MTNKSTQTKRQLFPYWREVSSIKDLPTNYQNADGIKKLAEQWQEATFNHINISTIEKYEYWNENIVQMDEDGLLSDFITYDCNDFDALSNEFRGQTDEGVEEWSVISDDDLKKDNEFIEFVKEHEEFESYKEGKEPENYPMWNTLFEFKSQSTESINKACTDSGFGLVDAFEDFNNLLFVAGCGYSFYGQHWIPAFLNMPWNSRLKKECEDLKLTFYHL